MTSPADTLSPFFFFHATKVPSVIVSLNFGIWISGMANLGSGVTNLLHGSDQLLHAWEHSFLEPLIVWHRHVFLRNPKNRGIELIEHFLLDPIRDFRPHPAKGTVLFDDHNPMRFAYRTQDRFQIQR